MGSYSDNTPAIHDLAQKMISNSMIDTSLYSKYNVKRGLRDLDGKGVLTGLTDISTIIQNKEVDGKLVPCDGELYYRGYNVNDIVVYSPNGVCRIDEITKHDFSGEPIEYYVLHPVSGGKNTYYVPTHNGDLASHMRRTLSPDEIKELLKNTVVDRSRRKELER